MTDTSHICPVCGKHTFEEHDSYDVCPTCGWGDDSLQESKPNLAGGFNHMSLNEAKKAYSYGKKIA